MRSGRPMRITASAVIALCSVALCTTATASIIDGPTTAYTPVGLASGNPMDYLGDQQTGNPEADIVGSTTSPGFYAGYADGGSALLTAGNLVFRIRVGVDKNSDGQFNAAALV